MCFVGTNLLWDQAWHKYLFIVNLLQSTLHINSDPADSWISPVMHRVCRIMNNPQVRSWRNISICLKKPDTNNLSFVPEFLDSSFR